jgi:hypothetical protein
MRFDKGWRWSCELAETPRLQGTNHGFGNRSDEACLAIGVLIDGIPRR